MAIASTISWDIRTSGNDSNGGGYNTSASGTDRSQQDSAQVSIDNSSITATITGSTITFTGGYTPSSADVGNLVNVISTTGGTPPTLTRYEITGQTSSTWTIDSSSGASGATITSAKMGGAMATISSAQAAAVDGNTVNIKSGTYTQTSAIAIGVANMTWRGFGTSHGDGGTRPLITTSTNSTDIVHTSSNNGRQVFQNINFSNTAGTKGNGILQLSTHGTGQWWAVADCSFDGFVSGLNSDNVGSHFDVYQIVCRNVEIKNCTSHGLVSNAGIVSIVGCNFHNNTGNGVDLGTSITLCVAVDCISAANSTGLNSGGTKLILVNCDFANNGSRGLWGSSGDLLVMLINSIAYNNSSSDIDAGITGQVLNLSLAVSSNNAYATEAGWGTESDKVTLSASPFTSSSDFTLNNTVGGGAACKGTAQQPPSAGTGGLDIGAMQTPSGGGGGGAILSRVFSGY